MLCTYIVLNAKTKTKKQCLYTTCSELVLFWDRSRKSMNNLLSYCGLTDAGMNASEKDLHVKQIFCNIRKQNLKTVCLAVFL
jgi:hypothetical protein